MAIKKVIDIVTKENGGKTSSDNDGNNDATRAVLERLKEETGRSKFSMKEISNWTEVIKKARKERGVK